jgi:hypothetical protein
MDVSATLHVPYPPAAVFPWLADLGRYPSWLDIVKRADPVPDARPTADERGAVPGPAWSVDLRARLGPVARSKRLRMVRTVCEDDRVVRFERAEVDGRDHSSWVLDGKLVSTADGCWLTMTLQYAGGALAPLVQRFLNDEIDRSGRRLVDLVASGQSA